MGKATKTKVGKPKLVLVAVNDPTLERQRRDVFDPIDAPRMVDEQIGRDRLLKTRRQASRIRRMESERWINRAEAAALERYETLVEAAGYGTGMASCIDMSVRGPGGNADHFERLAAKRQDLAAARNSVNDQVALIFTDAVLSPYGGEAIEDVAERMIRGSRSSRRERGRFLIAYTAAALMVHFSG